MLSNLEPESPYSSFNLNLGSELAPLHRVALRQSRETRPERVRARPQDVPEPARLRDPIRRLPDWRQRRGGGGGGGGASSTPA